jgi:O-antigen/teichoic acid export membrane protein
VTKGIRLPLQFVVLALLARALGPEGFGKWAMVLAAGMLMAPLLTWTQAAAVRFGKEEWLMHGSIWKTWQGRRLWLLWGVIAAGILVWAEPFGWLEQIYGLTGILAVATLAVLAGAWCAGEAQAIGQILGSLRMFSIYQVLADVLLVLVALVLATTEAGFGDLSVSILALAFSVALLWVCVWITALKGQLGGIVRASKPSAGAIAKYSWPLLPGALIAYISDWGNQLLLNHYFNLRQVGLFQMAYQLMAVLWGGSALLSIVATPRLVARHVAAPSDTASWFVNNFFPTVAILWLLGSIPLLLAAPAVLDYLMGKTFQEAVIPFVILCATIPGAAISGLLGTLYNLEGQLFKSAVVFAALVSGISLAVSFTLVPTYGVRGAAIGTVLAYLVGQGLFLVDQSIRYGKRYQRLAAVYLLAVSFAATQALAPLTWDIRMLVGVGFIVIVVSTSRALCLVDRQVMMSLLPAALASISQTFCYLLVAEKPR